MPFKSEAQRRFMYARHPRIAARWQKEAERSGVAKKKLPMHVSDQQSRQELVDAMARKVVAARENARRVKRPGTARPMRPVRPMRKGASK